MHLARQEAEGGVQRLVAIKTLRLELTKSAEFLELFRNEARIAARLTHPNIVQVYDFGMESGQFFIAMEFVEGCTLRQLMHRARRFAYPIPFDAIVALGCVIRGETPHFDFVCEEATLGLGAVARASNIPVLFGVLTTDDATQARARAGEGKDNKGYEAALAALEMVAVYRALEGN